MKKPNRFLSGKIAFPDEQQEKEFESVLARLTADRRPVGFAEETQVEIMALSMLSMCDLHAWEFAAVSNRTNSLVAMQAIIENGGSRELLREATKQGWQVRELSCRTITRSMGEDDDLLDDMTDKIANFAVEAKLTDRLDLVLRYKAAAQRQYYRALAALLALQRERIELDQLQALNGGER